MNRPYAVFDIDGTLIRWQLLHALTDQLVRDGHLDQTRYEPIKQARSDWKKRANSDAFNRYESLLIEFIDNYLSEVKVSDFEVVCRQVITKYADQVYSFTRDLISQLKAEHYLLFAISGAPDIMVRLLGDYYGFDEARGTTLGSKDGLFDGNKDLVWQHRKLEILNELINKHSASQPKSIAVGDSEGDIEMLQSTDQRIAFNPTLKLYEHAIKQGWEIVIERKNVVYRLRSQNGSYLLV